MSNMQLYLTVGLPTFAVLIGILINSMQYTTLNARMSSLDTRMSNLESRFDLLTSKVIDVDNRLIRVETRFEERFNR